MTRYLGYFSNKICHQELSKSSNLVTLLGIEVDFKVQTKWFEHLEFDYSLSSLALSKQQQQKWVSSF